MKTKATLLTTALLALHIGAASAAVISVTERSASETFFTANATDLVNNGQSTLGSVTGSDSMTYVGAGGLPTLNNGAIGIDSGFPGFNAAALNDIALAPDGQTSFQTITLTLDTTVNTFGYDIQAVQTIAAWQGARSEQSYQLFYNTVSDATYFSLGTVNTAVGPSPVGGSTRVSFFDSVLNVPTGLAIASGVKSLQIQYYPGYASFDPFVLDSTAYREVDVIGVASVPEPSTYAMLIAGAAAVFFMRARKNQNRA